MGSHDWTTTEVGPFRVTDAWFPPGAELPAHTHDRPCMGVTLEGSFDLTFPGQLFECAPTSVSIEPLGERHSNRIGNAGAHLLVLQPDPGASELLRPCENLLSRVTHRRHPGVAGDAWRLTQELRASDSAAALSIEGLILQMLAAATRLDESDPLGAGVPQWLERAHELIRARFRERLTMRHIADEVGVHPVHLGRSFRARYRVLIGTYVRRLRLEWASRQLASSGASLAAIALQAGFTDQSHFTRLFKTYAGVTPAQYRRLVTGERDRYQNGEPGYPGRPASAPARSTT